MEMQAYKDVLLKASYYKEQVTKEMMKKGLFPDDRSIQDRLDRIDKYIALFQHTSVKSGDPFDTDDFKKAMLLIYQDLVFLYQLTYELSVKELEHTKSYVEAHLSELESLADSYRQRSRIEIDSTSLGETILFKTNGFSTFNRDNTTYVSLGNIRIKDGSTIAFLLDATNAKPEEALLELESGDGETYHVTPYNYIQDTLKMPGDIVTKSYSFETEQDQIINTSFEVNAEGLQPTEKNEYLIFGGLDNVLLRNSNGRNFIKKGENNSFYAREEGMIELVIYKGTYANFNFTRAPEGKNFSGNSIDNLSDYHTISIRSEGELAFSIITDGQVYAVMERGIVKGDKLFYPNSTEARAFVIEEISPGVSRPYNAYLKVINPNEAPISMNYIAIKELSALGVEKR